MKYLLINPPVYDVLLFVGNSQPAHLLRIGALLKSQGHTVDFFDFDPINMTGPDQVSVSSEITRAPERTEIIKTYGKTDVAVLLNRFGKRSEEFEQFLTTIQKPDMIFVTSLMTFHYRGVHEVIALCKKIYPDVEITLGGIYATLCPEHARRSLADHVFVGEIPEANLMKPDMDLLESVPEYAILKTRWGCPNQCSYCAVHKLEGRKIRSIPPDLVFKQVKDLHIDYGIRYFYFWDSNILLNWDEHLGSILKKVRRSKLDIRIDLTYGFQPNLLTKEICLQMKNSNVPDFFPLPIESADEQLCRERFHRKTTAHDLKKAVAMLRAVGYRNFMFYVLVGMPEQSLDSILKSCELAWELGGKPIILSFTPIPCTEEYDNYRHLIEGKDLEDLMPNMLPFCTNEGQLDELLQLRDYSMKTVAETKNLLESQLHVKTWQRLNELYADE